MKPFERQIQANQTMETDENVSNVRLIFDESDRNFSLLRLM